MVIKKFTAKTEEEALAMARKELGEDVTVVHSRKVKPTGLFSFLKKTQVEITVAREEEPDHAAVIRSGIAAIDQVRQNAERAGKTAQAVPPREEEREKEDNTESVNSVEEKLNNIQFLLEQKLSKNAALKEQEEEKKQEEPVVEKTPEEKKQEEEKQAQLDFLKLLYHTMTDNEVDEKYANHMIEEIEQNFGKDMNVEHILSHVYQKIVLKFGKPEGLIPGENGAKLVFFIGPTGVGKTTTLAKIASHYALVKKKKVVLFTADTYRISATDQLKTYANILGVPFHIIYAKDELISLYERYKDYDYIMVDTAGHSHKNKEQQADTAAYLHMLDDKAQSDKFLVLSATTKYSDLLSIVDSYREITDFKLIFTKLDETTTCGNLLNIRMHTMAPICFVTNGQKVPDDIEVFNPQITVKKLLGGKN